MGRSVPAARAGRGGGAGTRGRDSGVRNLAGGPADAGVVEVRRSARRRRTVTAYREKGRTVVLKLRFDPSAMPAKAELEALALGLGATDDTRLKVLGSL